MSVKELRLWTCLEPRSGNILFLNQGVSKDAGTTQYRAHPCDELAPRTPERE